MITFNRDSGTFRLSKKALKALIEWTCPDVARIGLCQARFCPETEQVQATCGHAALNWRAGGGCPVNVTDRTWCVPSAALKSANALVGAGGSVVIDCNTVVVLDKLGNSVATVPVGGPYSRFPPDFYKVFPTLPTGHKDRTGFNPELLARLETLPTLVDDRKGPYTIELFSGFSNLDPFTARISGPVGDTVTAVIMPMRLKEQRST
jgi:hypothetical protein